MNLPARGETASDKQSDPDAGAPAGLRAASRRRSPRAKAPSLSDRLGKLAQLEDAHTAAGGFAMPGLFVSPPTADAVAACLREAAETGAIVAPWGGGTQQRAGNVAPRIDVAIGTTRLDAIVEWEPRDLTACIQAGATLDSVSAALAEQGQQIAIDAPAADRATIGGLIATNTSGPRRWLYGGWRDQIIGMQMALPSGDVIKSGGRVVKNVQGYDLAKLFIGSLGTLGMITQANVKLTPLPASRRILAFRGDLAQVSAFTEHVSDAPVRVSALDLLDAAAAQRCGLAGGGCVALVLIEGPEATVDGQTLSLAYMASSAALRSDSIEDGAIPPIWDSWLALARSDDLSDRQALITIGATPSETADVLRRLTESADKHGITAACWARAGNGVAYARLETPAGGTLQDAAAAIAAVQSQVMQRWPATTIVSGSVEVQRTVQPWGRPPATLELMRALKQRFDPLGIMQPSRYVGGI